jgi:hypothetical protein
VDVVLRTQIDLMEALPSGALLVIDTDVLIDDLRDQPQAVSWLEERSTAAVWPQPWFPRSKQIIVE